MSPQVREQIHQEVELVERCAAYYRRQFNQLIAEINHSHSPQESHAIRLCIEAVDMLLTTQNRLAQAIDRLGAG